MKKILFIMSIGVFTQVFSHHDYARQLIKTYLPENPVILDAGAHDGGDTLKTRQVWPNATIYAFEPLPELFNRLKENTKNFPNIHCYPLALSDKTGRAKFYISTSGSDCSHSLLAPKDHLKYHPDVLFEKTTEVLVMNLDEWAKMNNINKIDFMWLDMQGAEMQMLQAAPEILKTVSVIYSEVNFYEVYEGCPTYPQYRAWLESQGFKVVFEDIKRWIDFGDVLFVRNK